MENVATTHCFALFARFLHFHENNDLKVPERSKNGPKKVPILSQRPKFCLCSDFSRQVPNPKSYIGAPDKVVLSAGSSFFEQILKSHKHPSPLVYLKGVEAKHMELLLDFMYCGEVAVEQEELESFMRSGEEQG